MCGVELDMGAQLQSLDSLLPLDCAVPLSALFGRTDSLLFSWLKLFEPVSALCVISFVRSGELLLLSCEHLRVAKVRLLAQAILRSPAVMPAILVVACVSNLRFVSPSHLCFGRVH